jgi:hypothetical protein
MYMYDGGGTVGAASCCAEYQFKLSKPLGQKIPKVFFFSLANVERNVIL